VECRHSGQSVKALLLCSPNNPLGFMFTREELENIVSWTRQNGLQLIVDEIYGLSVFSKSSKLVSIGSVLDELGDDVHFVWSFSKDFCMSGLRAGVIYTENRMARTALRFLPYFCGVSGDTQFALTQVCLLCRCRRLDGSMSCGFSSCYRIPSLCRILFVKIPSACMKRIAFIVVVWTNWVFPMFLVKQVSLFG